MAEPKKLAAYAAVYTDRGDKLDRGRNAIKAQFGLVRQAAATEGNVISIVGVDVIVGKGDAGRLERLVTEAERLAHEAFADDDADPTFVVVGLVSETSSHDPRMGNPHAALNAVVSGMPELPDSAIVSPTEHGYEIRGIES